MRWACSNSPAYDYYENMLVTVWYSIALDDLQECGEAEIKDELIWTLPKNETQKKRDEGREHWETKTICIDYIT